MAPGGRLLRISKVRAGGPRCECGSGARGFVGLESSGSLRHVAEVSTGMTLDPQSTDSIQQIGVIPTIYPPLARHDPSNVISVDTEGATRSPQTEEYCSHAADRGVFAASVEGAATCADAGVGQLCESVS